MGTGRLSRVRGLAVPQDYREVAAGLLEDPDLSSFDSAAAVVDHVSRKPAAIGLVPWEAVTPQVKALAVDGQALLAADEASIEGYPLAPESAEAPDLEKLQRVVVGGDVVLDRGQSYAVIQQGRGIDFPMDGGYAAITSRARVPNPYAPSEFVNEFTAERRGGAGAVRKYLSSADLTLANLENPVVEDAVWHPEGTAFTGDPRLLPILDQAGIDGATLGNNHILDAGAPGISETKRYLEGAGISYSGAGMDLSSAREPMVFDLGGVKLGVLSYLDIPGYEWAWATDNSAGTAPLREEVMKEDIERLRAEVDVVLVMPHWGTEYLATPEPGQVELAHAAVDAGADLVVGGHAHWIKGIEVYEKSPIFYGVGNFFFDQSWSENTSTGIFAEITLYDDQPI
ncbi:MAG: CapA family protein, partial [Rubrobacteraceae bacterium]